MLGFEQAENYIQTAVSEAWFLEEQIKMDRIKKQDHSSRRFIYSGRSIFKM